LDPQGYYVVFHVEHIISRSSLFHIRRFSTKRLFRFSSTINQG